MADSRHSPNRKRDFARKLLEANPAADSAAVNRAWRDDGRDGKISKALYAEAKAALDRATKPAGDGVLPRPTEEPSLGEQLELECDRLLFQVMRAGGFAEAEELIRRARRLIILSTRE
jgi:hypothetical protein